MPTVTITQPAIITVRVGGGIIPRVTEITTVSTSPPIVKVDNGAQQRVSSVNSSINSLSHLSDVNMIGAIDGSVVVYQANTNNFVVETLTSVLNTIVDGGAF